MSLAATSLSSFPEALHPPFATEGPGEITAVDATVTDMAEFKRKRDFLLTISGMTELQLASFILSRINDDVTELVASPRRRTIVNSPGIDTF